MRAVIQRVSEASLVIDGEETVSLGAGLVILLGVENDDQHEDINWLAKKIYQLRIFDDEGGVMNRSVEDVDGDMLVVSQFTLYAKTKKGNRPSYIAAAKHEIAIPMYEAFVKKLHQLSGKAIKTGEFGADMKVSLINDGPVTIIIDTKNKE